MGGDSGSQNDHLGHVGGSCLLFWCPKWGLVTGWWVMSMVLVIIMMLLFDG